MEVGKKYSYRHDNGRHWECLFVLPGQLSVLRSTDGIVRAIHAGYWRGWEEVVDPVKLEAWVVFHKYKGSEEIYTTTFSHAENAGTFFSKMQDATQVLKTVHVVDEYTPK